MVSGRQMKQKARVLATAVFMTVVFLTVHSMAAFTFEPISSDFSPSGKNSVRTFRLENKTEETVAVQIGIFSRRADENGADILENADDSFLVYPSRAVLRPNGFQAVRVQWRGIAAPSTELPFRIIAEQLPVDFSGGKSKGNTINIMFKYIGSIYIVPEGVKPDIRVKSVAVVGNGEDRRLETVLENGGNAHVIIGDPVMEIFPLSDDSAKAHVTLSGDLLNEIAGKNVLAGHRRRFSFTCPPDIPDGPLGATIRYDPIR